MKLEFLKIKISYFHSVFLIKKNVGVFNYRFLNKAKVFIYIFKKYYHSII